jgi:hypothetical protein
VVIDAKIRKKVRNYSAKKNTKEVKKDLTGFF